MIRIMPIFICSNSVGFCRVVYRVKDSYQVFQYALVLLFGLSLSACVAPQLDASGSAISAAKLGSEIAPVKLNQLGYRPGTRKVAIVPLAAKTSALQTFELVRTLDGVVVLTGQLSKPSVWPFSNEVVQQADFSSFNQPGEYLVRVNGVGDSYAFLIDDGVLGDVHNAALKSFYLNRSGIAIDAQYGGKHARQAGHPDVNVKVHRSAASEARPEGTIVSAPKGWYDAGDYGKYIVNSGISTYTLLASYQHFKDYYKNLDLAIPESTNSVPDILDEIKWNLDWMEKMQDSDGGVYHKLTLLNFSAIDVTPANENKQRYVIGKSVTAALNFAAVMAVASRVMQEFEGQFPGISERYKGHALRAYDWAQKNSDALYEQPEDVATGAYEDKDANDEFAWAAAELFLLTGDAGYFAEFVNRNADPQSNLSWQKVGALGYISLANFGESMLGKQQYADIVLRLTSAADQHYELYADSAYDVAIDLPDFEWGSNSDALNNGLVLFQAYRLTGQAKYKDAALSTVDYVLGKNATGYSFVTEYGDRTPVNIHHRPSVADNTLVPVPGFIAGGPHTGRQDNCDYPGDQPATNYVDTVCSYSTNEIAINWNAPLVYMLAAANSPN